MRIFNIKIYLFLQVAPLKKAYKIKLSFIINYYIDDIQKIFKKMKLLRRLIRA